jgi:spermidine/putrescine transport system ATP-binding protein
VSATFLAISNVTKSFTTPEGGVVHALDDVSLDIKQGEFFVMLGPSGCGKTTLLRSIAGLEYPDSGTIELDGERIDDKAAYLRPVNTVFQSYALFPHMTVAQNVAFGLEMEGVDKKEIETRVAAVLEQVKLTGYDKRKPAQLSGGGQQQRVALARALVKNPKILLLDEPLSALDLKLRRGMQVELKRLQQETGITFVFVTHDQEEAMSMGDRIAVFNSGKIVQLDTPQEIYRRPVNSFVADFIGETNLLAGTASAEGIVLETGVLRRDSSALAADISLPESGEVTVAVRPEDLVVVESGGFISGTVRDVIFTGDSVRIHVTTGSREIVVALASHGVRIPERDSQVNLDAIAGSARTVRA